MDVTGSAWRTSSYSGSNGGTCVEVADNLPEMVSVRDSKDPDGAVLRFSRGDWAAFVTGIREAR